MMAYHDHPEKFKYFDFSGPSVVLQIYMDIMNN